MYACRQGACKGQEAIAAAWDKVGDATLALKPASSGLVLEPAVTLRPNDERGFYLHAPDHGFAVAFSKPGEEFRSAHLLVRPWFQTVSSTPHAGVSTSKREWKYAPAGKLLYEVQGA